MSPRTTLPGAVLIAGVFFLGGIALGWFGRGVPPPGREGDTGEPSFVFENPLARVQVGEWALYRTLDGNTRRLEVLESPHPRTGVVRVKDVVWNTRADRLVASTVDLLPPNRFLSGFDEEGARIERVYPGEVTVAGRTWKALCFEIVTPARGRLREWVSDEAPVTGFLKREKRNAGGPFSVDRELVEWGMPEGGR